MKYLCVEYNSDYFFLNGEKQEADWLSSLNMRRLIDTQARAASIPRKSWLNTRHTLDLVNIANS